MLYLKTHTWLILSKLKQSNVPPIFKVKDKELLSTIGPHPSFIMLIVKIFYRYLLTDRD